MRQSCGFLIRCPSDNDGNKLSNIVFSSFLERGPGLEGSHSETYASRPSSLIFSYCFRLPVH